MAHGLAGWSVRGPAQEWRPSSRRIAAKSTTPGPCCSATRYSWSRKRVSRAGATLPSVTSTFAMSGTTATFPTS